MPDLRLEAVAGVGHRTGMRRKPSATQRRDRAEHAATILLVVNALVMGLAAAAFARGPYSSFEQESWYRYGSIGLFMAGVVVPAAALVVLRRTGPILLAATLWMGLALIAFAWFVAMSGGGV